MLKSETRQTSEKQQKRTRRVNFATVNNRFGGLFCLQGGRISGGAFISQRFYAGEEFLHLREQTKIKRFTDLSGIRFVCGRTM